MLPDDGGSLSGRDVVAWFPFRLVGDGVETIHDELLPPREPEPSAHLGIMPDDLELVVGKRIQRRIVEREPATNTAGANINPPAGPVRSTTGVFGLCVTIQT